MTEESRPVVAITGSAGNIGTALREALQSEYRVVGFDRPGTDCDIAMDITSNGAVNDALASFREQYGEHIAAIIHLAAYFDFSGEESPLYREVNVEGTRRLVEALQSFEVERFIYSSTMLVHAPCERGQLIDEDSPIGPRWVYPQSKADSEEVIQQHHGDMPYTLLRLAGLYDDETGVPTLTHQIARIYEKDLKSYLYAGDPLAGQAFIHKDDMIDLFKRVVDRRNDLPGQDAMLAGEPDVMSYEALQHEIGELIHGEEWHTYTLPGPVAKAGAWLEEKAEPFIPDAFDGGQKPFIKPFMIDMASDHYALDISRAREALDWHPQHHIKDGLPHIVDALLEDPDGWYEDNAIPKPNWMEAAEEKSRHPEGLAQRYETYYQDTHRQNLWAHFLNIGLGLWMMTAPATLGYESNALGISDVISGILILIFSACSLSAGTWMRFSRFLSGAVGLWLLFAPLIFWAPTASAYLNDTLVGTLVIGLSVLTRPFPAMSPAAAMTGPEVPPGWDFTPSSWFQRIPVIALAFVGFFISRYLCAYQLGHIDSVWEPFFGGDIPGDNKNGTEEIITSRVSEAWPVPDAGLGALTYLLEIITGMIGSNKRWRTMPWLVLLFGFMIIPLGAISITFIIIQPIMLGTWCSLCLVAAMAMLIQIPYSFDEIVATIEFLRRRARAGRPWLKLLFTGDTDEGSKKDMVEDNFRQSPSAVIRDIVTGGVSVPWNLAVCCLIGLWLMFTRLTMGHSGNMADADHLIGSLIITITVTAFAEVTRPLRFANMFLGAALLITPFVYGAGALSVAVSMVCGLALIILSYRRGPIENNWGEWNRVIL